MVFTDIISVLSVYKGVLPALRYDLHITEKRQAAKQVRRQLPGKGTGAFHYHRDVRRRVLPQQKGEQEQAMADGVLPRCGRQKGTLLLEQNPVLILSGQLVQPHQVVRHDGIPAGNGPVIGLLRVEEKLLTARGAQEKTAPLPVGKPLHCLPAQRFGYKENEYGTVLFYNKYFNLIPELDNINDDKILMYYIDPNGLTSKEVIAILKGKKIDYDNKFYENKTVYKVGDLK